VTGVGDAAIMTNAVGMMASAVTSRRAGTNGSGSSLREYGVRISGAPGNCAHHMRTRSRMAATTLNRGLFGTSQMSLVCPRGGGSRV
jgi:hypothetical protein